MWQNSQIYQRGKINPISLKWNTNKPEGWMRYKVETDKIANEMMKLTEEIHDINNLMNKIINWRKKLSLLHLARLKLRI